jgi:hypothetical protein
MTYLDYMEIVEKQLAKYFQYILLEKGKKLAE